MGVTAGPVSPSGEGMPKNVRILQFPHKLEDRSNPIHIEDVRVLTNRVVFLRDGKLMGKKYP